VLAAIQAVPFEGTQIRPSRVTAKPAIGVTPDFIAPFAEKQGAPSAPAPPSAYREWIEQGLARGRMARRSGQDLVSDHGFAGGYQAIKRFVTHASRATTSGSGGHYPHGRRRSASRLRQRSDGARTAEWQVSFDLGRNSVRPLLRLAACIRSVLQMAIKPGQ